MHFIHNPFGARELLHVVLAFGMVAVLGGCAHTYEVKVEALRSPVLAPRQTYRLVSAVEGRDEVDPQYAEIAKVVERALAAHGLHAASRPEWADIVVKVDYGTSAIRLQARPELGAPNSAAVGIFYPEKDGAPVAESRGVYVPAAALKRIVPIREKRLLVFARENKLGTHFGGDCGAELWRVEVGVEDESDSLQELLPILAGALLKHIDSTSAPACTERWSRSAPDVLLVSQES